MSDNKRLHELSAAVSPRPSSTPLRQKSLEFTVEVVRVPLGSGFRPPALPTPLPALTTPSSPPSSIRTAVSPRITALAPTESLEVCIELGRSVRPHPATLDVLPLPLLPPSRGRRPPHALSQRPSSMTAVRRSRPIPTMPPPSPLLRPPRARFAIKRKRRREDVVPPSVRRPVGCVSRLARARAVLFVKGGRLGLDKNTRGWFKWSANCWDDAVMCDLRRTVKRTFRAAFLSPDLAQRTLKTSFIGPPSLGSTVPPSSASILKRATTGLSSTGQRCVGTGCTSTSGRSASNDDEVAEEERTVESADRTEGDVGSARSELSAEAAEILDGKTTTSPASESRGWCQGLSHRTTREGERTHDRR